MRREKGKKTRFSLRSYNNWRVRTQSIHLALHTHSNKADFIGCWSDGGEATPPSKQGRKRPSRQTWKGEKTQPAAEKHLARTQPLLPPSVTFCLAGALQIENSEETDQGKYECVATNSQGVRYSSPANLYVRGRAWTQNTREHAHAEHAKTTTQNNYN